MQPLLIRGGRALPRLLFVTSKDALGSKIGVDQAERLLSGIRDQGFRMVDSLPVGMTASNASHRVRKEIEDGGLVDGVVLLGGYQVVPAEVVDCLPPSVRLLIPPHAIDPDDFVVWSDDTYGDSDADGIAEIPVSRIPDGGSVDLMLAALQTADEPSPLLRCGIRNVRRPFAEGVYASLPGSDALLVSEPTEAHQIPAFHLEGANTYLMLHGHFTDTSRFWGEMVSDGAMIEATNLTNIPASFAGVVFSGCCWGALPVDVPASPALKGHAVTDRPRGTSIALEFLGAGARAFVGCTGAHYSPTVAPFEYFGGPMHTTFWQQVALGVAPAAALFEARRAFIRNFPHNRLSPSDVAIEYKTFRQFTCLGLGW